MEYDPSYYTEEAEKLALEIERKLAILNIDWRDQAALHALANRLLAVRGGIQQDDGSDPWEHAWLDLQGLVVLMNTLMAEAANKDIELHGNACWKALSRAMWAEKPDAAR